MRKSKLIGDRIFYSKIFAILLPILLQNLITNFVSLLDNIMVGQVGTEQMSGVAIVNQLIFVFNLAMFGVVSGGGVFSAQYFGKGDQKGVADALKTKLYGAFILVSITILLAVFKGDFLINAFLHDSSDGLNLALTFENADRYLKIMLIGFIPFAITQSVGSTLREISRTIVPMRAGLIAVAVNLFFNWVLIYGKLGAPALGVAGAAIATVLSRYVECLIVVFWPILHRNEAEFVNHFKGFGVPKPLMQGVIKIGIPMFLNELLWGGGQTMLNQIMSYRGLAVVSGLNISSTVSILFECAYLSIGVALSIILGQSLGAGEMERAYDESRKISFFSVVMSTFIGLIMVLVARQIPNIYNTTDAVKQIAGNLIIISAACMPLKGYVICLYYTIRSGGKTFITFLFDSCYTWVVCIPAVFFLIHRTDLDIIRVNIWFQVAANIKIIVGWLLVKSRFWLVNLVEKH